MNILNIVIYFLIGYNFLVFIIYGADKMFAGSGSRRISEKTLLILVLFAGSVGAIIAMYTFRHKTRKTSFQFWLYLILLIQVIAGYIIYINI